MLLSISMLVSASPISAMSLFPTWEANMRKDPLLRCFQKLLSLNCTTAASALRLLFAGPEFENINSNKKFSQDNFWCKSLEGIAGKCLSISYLIGMFSIEWFKSSVCSCKWFPVKLLGSFSNLAPAAAGLLLHTTCRTPTGQNQEEMVRIWNVGTISWVGF